MITENHRCKNILGLKLPSDPRWVNLAEMQLEEILTDHAYCEQKAATTCISLIQRYPDKEKLVTETKSDRYRRMGAFSFSAGRIAQKEIEAG